jgi:hypothetical protein
MKMTKQFWDECNDIHFLAGYIPSHASDRKFQYYHIACCRRIACLLPNPVSIQGIDLLEEYVEGRVSDEKVDRMSWDVEGAAFRIDYYTTRSERFARYWDDWEDVTDVGTSISYNSRPDKDDWQVEEWIEKADKELSDELRMELTNSSKRLDMSTQKLLKKAAYFVDRCFRSTPCRDISHEGAPHFQSAHLLRDIFGNPFRPVAFDPAWQTSTAVGIALQMYDSRDFAAMPILADALQDAGCEDATILDHCRDEKQVHVRGCWVVDLVLGKS